MNYFKEFTVCKKNYKKSIEQGEVIGLKSLITNNIKLSIISMISIGGQTRSTGYMQTFYQECWAPLASNLESIECKDVC